MQQDTPSEFKRFVVAHYPVGFLLPFIPVIPALGIGFCRHPASVAVGCYLACGGILIHKFAANATEKQAQFRYFSRYF